MNQFIKIAVDVETSGLDHRIHSLMSIGAVVVGDESTCFYQECVPDPKREICQVALEVNGLSVDERPGVCVSPAAMIDKFSTWIRKVTDGSKWCMVGKNILFDYLFIREFSVDKKFLERVPVEDVHSYARLFGFVNHWDMNHSSVYDIYKSFGFNREPLPHNALTDAMSAARIYQWFLENGITKNV